MKKITPIIACFLAVFLHSCYEESFVQTIEPKRGWQVQNSGTKYPLTDVFFIDENTGWIVSVLDTVLKTTDGGKNWKKYYCANIDDYGSLHFTDHNNGWLIGSRGKLMRSIDGGKTWSEKNYSNNWNAGGLHSLSFTTTGTGAFADGYGTIYFTHDNGESWNVRLGEDNKRIGTVEFIDKINGWATGIRYDENSSGPNRNYSWFLLTTNDGGSTCIENQDSAVQLSSFRFLSPNLGWGFKSNRFVRTLDGGVTWENRGDTLTNFRNYFFADDLNGWLIEPLPRVLSGSQGYFTIRHTKDGGQTWQYQNMPAYQNGEYITLGRMHFVNSRVGWAVGDHGAIWHTKTGGEPE